MTAYSECPGESNNRRGGMQSVLSSAAGSVLHVGLAMRWCRRLVAVTLTAVVLFGALRMYATPFSSIMKPARMMHGNCTPLTNIALLKSHKCASSAIQNILFRYGYKHNLHFALPDRGNYFGGGRKSFKAEMVRSSSLNQLEPNIFAMHTKWDFNEVQKVMPKDTFYITIVREPSALFQSLFSYYKFQEEKGMTIEEYVKQEAADAPRYHDFIGYNQMTWDFGMPKENLSNLTAVRKMIERADDQFRLVMVAERMEESLVLLADQLCWELKDVLVLRVNSLRDEFKQSLSPEARRLLQQKLAPDYLVYRHFAARFQLQVEAFGKDRMAARVKILREMNSLLMDTCDFVRKAATRLKGTLRPWSNKVDGFADTGRGECSLYSLPELPFIDMVRKKQRKNLMK